MSNCAITIIVLLRCTLCFGHFPIYTIPDKIGPWSPIDIRNLNCPNNLIVEDEGCNTLTPFSYMELKIGYIKAIKVEGFTCTGVVTEAETYTNFLGYVTTTFKRKHFRPSMNRCLDAYRWKVNGDPRYEESLHNPYPDSSWLRTVTTAKESLLIISPSVADMDAYDKQLYAAIFPDGKCTNLLPGAFYCPTNHEYTIWMPRDHRLNLACDIFVNSRGKMAIKDGKMCGFIDERGLYKSLKGACKLKLCGISGIRLVDGSWVSIQRRTPPEPCAPGQLVNMHDLRTEEIEHLIVDDLVKKREECLDALETIMSTKTVSFRRLSHFRKLVPGFGKAYTLINKTLMEADAHYKSIKNWSDVIPSKGCLRIGGYCHPHYDGIFFNGIIMSPHGDVLIPEMQSALLQQHIELLESSVIPLRHPLADPSTVLREGNDVEDFFDVHLPEVQKHVSDINLGLPEWKHYFYIGVALLALIALSIIAVVFCRRFKRRKKSPQAPIELVRRASVTSVSGRPVPSWESYKTGRQTNLEVVPSPHETPTNPLRK
ncbi:glycoprotein [Taiwan bat lyssavirus 1]|nr:glycoprotein [Taiwan bat lyssavirus 1]